MTTLAPATVSAGEALGARISTASARAPRPVIVTPVGTVSVLLSWRIRGASTVTEWPFSTAVSNFDTGSPSAIVTVSVADAGTGKPTMPSTVVNAVRNESSESDARDANERRTRSGEAQPICV